MLTEKELKNLSDGLEDIENKTNKLGKIISNYRDGAFSRFPTLFVLLSSFGLAATFYGFEKVIDQISFFNNNPITILLTGIAILVVTGTLFKKLS